MSVFNASSYSLGVLHTQLHENSLQNTARHVEAEQGCTRSARNHATRCNHWDSAGERFAPSVRAPCRVSAEIRYDAEPISHRHHATAALPGLAARNRSDQH